LGKGRRNNRGLLALLNDVVCGNDVCGYQICGDRAGAAGFCRGGIGGGYRTAGTADFWSYRKLS